MRLSTSLKILLPGHPPHVKNPMISASLPYCSKCTFRLLNALKHATPGHVSLTISQRTTAIFVVFSSFPPIPIIALNCEAASLTSSIAVSYTHLRAHETRHDIVCRLL